MKKKYTFYFFTLCLGICAIFTACANKDNDTIPTIEPGIYYIGMDLTAEGTSTTTRGFRGGHGFNDTYDPDVIYLHANGKSLPLPVYQCPMPENCRGFRYRIDKRDDGSAIINPIKENGEVDNTQSITIPSGGKCYFSSYPTDDWKMEKEQIVERSNSVGESFNFYRRKSDKNIEIYRSITGEGSNTFSSYTIDELATNGSIIMGRACTAICATLGFFDETKIDHEELTNQLLEEDFRSVLGEPENWYVKIYIGGPCFMPSYSIAQGKENESSDGGFYSTHDSKKYEEDGIDAEINPFIPISNCSYSSGSLTITGLGYTSKSNNYLIAPVDGINPINVYIMVKHWTGSDKPGEEWLLSEEGAMVTTINTTSTPANCNFYNYGLIIDINAFKNGWLAGGGDPTGIPGVSTATISTNFSKHSMWGVGIREFTIENPIIICDVY